MSPRALARIILSTMLNVFPTPAADGSTHTSAPAGRLVVCESTSRWAAALRRELAARAVRVWEARTLAAAHALLAETPAAILVVELARANLDDLPGWLATARSDYPRARFAVVAERGLADYEWLLREAGAVHFLTSSRQLRPLIEIVTRHLAFVPPLPQTPLERIWNKLPLR